MKSIPALAAALAAAVAQAQSIDFVAVTIAFPEPDSLVKFDVLNPSQTTTPVAVLAGGWVRGLDMDTSTTGWYIVSAGTTAGFYRLADGISNFIGPVPETSVNIGGLTLNQDKSFLYYAIRDGASGPVLLYRVDFSGIFTFLGNISGISSPRIGGLAVHPDTGVLYAINMPDGRLYTIDPATAAAMPVGTGLGFAVSNLVGGLDFTADGRLFMVSNQGEIREVDHMTGVAGPVLGSLGIASSAIAYLPQDPDPCYANCNGNTMEPILTVDDFTCFINEFAAAQTLPPAQQITHYANCDGSTTVPVLTVDDFTCFINEFAQGCP